MFDSRPRGRWFETNQRHCLVSLSKNINPSLVLVQHRKTGPYITERMLMGCKESNQTKTKHIFCYYQAKISDIETFGQNTVGGSHQKLLKILFIVCFFEELY